MTATLPTDKYKAHFSGHETFPLRQMWLKKVYAQALIGRALPKSTFTKDQAIADFGVGKNMVASIRHWALACGVIQENEQGSYTLTETAELIFSDSGLDPYSENSATTWYVHWCLARKRTRATTWYWLFNHVTALSFTRDELAKPLMNYALGLDNKRKLSESTISRDIETCLRSYAPRTVGAYPEDYAEAMLGELGLISEDRKGHFAFRRGPKASLSNGLFTYALLDYWSDYCPDVSSLSFETIAYADGSPGRVFKLDEDSVAERLFVLNDITRGALSWTDTAGLRQVHKKANMPVTLSHLMLNLAYE